jgi:hypothetical protein
MGGAKRYPSWATRLGDGFRNGSTHPTALNMGQDKEKQDHPAQSKRFIDTAREAEADD